MSLMLRQAASTSFCFPRVSGDEPAMQDATEGRDPFFPRERG